MLRTLLILVPYSSLSTPLAKTFWGLALRRLGCRMDHHRQPPHLGFSPTGSGVPCRFTFGIVSGPNVLTNVDGLDATIGVGPSAASFRLASFFATPVYVDTLTLALVGTTVDGATLEATFTIVNPERTLVGDYLGSRA